MAKHSENVTAVQVSDRFDKQRSTKSTPVEVRLNTGSGVKVGVPKTVDDTGQPIFNPRLKLPAYHVFSEMSARTGVAMSGITVGTGTND